MYLELLTEGREEPQLKPWGQDDDEGLCPVLRTLGWAFPLLFSPLLVDVTQPQGRERVGHTTNPPDASEWYGYIASVAGVHSLSLSLSFFGGSGTCA
jgi:hypothetical protein